MVALRNWADHYIFILWFLSSILYLLFFLPNLSGWRLDVYHTPIHGVALVRIYYAGLKCAAGGSQKVHDAKKSPKSTSGHHRTNLSAYIFTTKAHIDIRKKTLSSNMSSRCPHNMVNFGPLKAEISSGVWGTPGGIAA